MFKPQSAPCLAFLFALLCALATSCRAPLSPEEREVLEESELYLDTSSAAPGVLEKRLSVVLDPGEALDTQVALAYGLSDRAELSASWNPHGYTSQRGPDPRHASLLEVQWLTRFREEQESAPSLALRSQLAIPVRDGDEPEQPARGRLGLLATRSLSRAVLTGEVGLSSELESVAPNSPRAFEVLAAAHGASYLGFGLGLFGSVEAAYDLRKEEDHASALLGLAYGRASNWTADLSLIRGFGSASSDVELRWGLTAYF